MSFHGEWWQNENFNWLRRCVCSEDFSSHLVVVFQRRDGQWGIVHCDEFDSEDYDNAQDAMDAADEWAE